VLGGLKLIDRGEADDKLIAVLEGDLVWGGARELADLPPALLERLRHYFETYKLVPGQPAAISIHSQYDYQAATRVLQASMDDYAEKYGARLGDG
jgi:inorganic pyrophosphatase